MDWGRWLQHHEIIKNLLHDSFSFEDEKDRENYEKWLNDKGKKEIYFEKSFLLAFAWLMSFGLGCKILTYILGGTSLFYLIKFIYA